LAIHLEALRAAGTLEFDHDGSPMVAVHDRSLDVAVLYRNPEELTVSLENGVAIVAGEEYGPIEVPLESVYGYEALWFA